MNERTYEKPKVTYWPAEELDAIEATMSGGGGGGGVGMRVGTAPEPYQWFQQGIHYSSTAIDLNNRILAIEIITAIVSLGLNGYVSAAISVANAIFYTCLSNNVDTLYYKSTLFELSRNACWHTSASPIWDYVGMASYDLFYADSAHTIFIEETLNSDLNDSESYLLDYLSDYLGV